MADLTENKPRRFVVEGLEHHDMPVAAAAVIYNGAALMEHTDGGMINADQSLGAFSGFARDKADNTGGAVAALSTNVAKRGYVWLTVAHTSTWARTDLGVTVYCSDSDTFTLDDATAANPSIGKVAHVPTAAVGNASGEILVYFEAQDLRSI